MSFLPIIFDDNLFKKMWKETKPSDCLTLDSKYFLANMEKAGRKETILLIAKAIEKAQDSFNVSKKMDTKAVVECAEKVIEKYCYETIFDIVFAMKNLALCKTEMKVFDRFDFQVVDIAIFEHLEKKYA